MMRTSRPGGPAWSNDRRADSYVRDDIELPPGEHRDGELIDGGRSRVESDAMGQVRVPAERLWGAQTQRALKHFAIGDGRLPLAVYRAYGHVKKAAAMVNRDEGGLAPDKARSIIAAADEVIDGRLDAEFPLFVAQSGSGTQTNMNVNEVIANRAIQLAGGVPGTKRPVHPNDDVNMSQSTNDTFVTAMHVATVLEVEDELLPPRRGARRRAVGEGGGLGRRGEDRPHAPAGRDAAHGRAGVVGLRGPAARRPRAGARGDWPASTRSRPGARRWARASTPRRGSGRPSPRASPS